MLAATLHTLAFAISLFVQFKSSALAGAWVFFLLAGCAVLLATGDLPKRKDATWCAALAWLLTIGLSGFILAPTINGAAYIWQLAAMPSLALCLRKEHLKPYLTGFLIVLTLYAAGVAAQMTLGTQTTKFHYEGRHSWPLLDPNNGAAVINLALLPCLYMAIFKDLRWYLLCALFALALVATGSKAGFIAAGVGTLILLSVRHGPDFLAFAAVMGMIFATATFLFRPEVVVLLAHSFADRFPIWEASLPLAFIRPFLGIGLGAYGFYYEKVRTEHYTSGWHSHNDLLQITIDMGIPAVLIFCSLAGSVVARTCRGNLPAAVTMLAVAMMSMVEFQFYVESVSLGMGLALGYFILNTPRKAPL